MITTPKATLLTPFLLALVMPTAPAITASEPYHRFTLSIQSQSQEQEEKPTNKVGTYDIPQKVATATGSRNAVTQAVLTAAGITPDYHDTVTIHFEKDQAKASDLVFTYETPQGYQRSNTSRLLGDNNWWYFSKHGNLPLLYLFFYGGAWQKQEVNRNTLEEDIDNLPYYIVQVQATPNQEEGTVTTVGYYLLQQSCARKSHSLQALEQYIRKVLRSKPSNQRNTTSGQNRDEEKQALNFFCFPIENEPSAPIIHFTSPSTDADNTTIEAQLEAQLDPLRKQAYTWYSALPFPPSTTTWSDNLQLPRATPKVYISSEQSSKTISCAVTTPGYNAPSYTLYVALASMVLGSTYIARKYFTTTPPQERAHEEEEATPPTQAQDEDEA